MPARSPALKAMTAAEKGELLDALLTDQPAWRNRVEALAATRMSAAARVTVAEEAEFALRGPDIDQLNDRAGCRPGVDLVDLLPEWDAVLRAQGHLRERRSA